MSRPPRIVLAKIGLDGHDRGVKVVARGLRDAGFHVIYSGLWQPVEAVVRTVADEDADFLGISLLSGAHLTLTPALMEALRLAGLAHVGVILGGIIPEDDVPKLLEMGVQRVFGPGSSMQEIAAYLRTHAIQESASGGAAIEVVQRFRQGDRLALARLLSWAADAEISPPIQAALQSDPSPPREAAVVAFTGNAGVGKSTLIGRTIELLRSRGKTVAVLACDPQSPLTGGALLGDRIRMSSRATDEGVFIRSVATGSGRQAIADNLELMTELLARFGFDVVLLETVGAGQGDTAIRDAANVVVLLVQPETGDELQWEKAGVLEIADVVAVNKADLPGAEQAEAQLRSMLHLPGCREIPIVRVSGRTNDGLNALWSSVESNLGSQS